MSSSTRVGFLIPASTDFADEGLYYNNNVTTYEAELPSVISPSLPGSGGYTGQVRTISLASPGSFAAANPEQTYVWNGAAWISIGAFGFKKDVNAKVPLQDGAYVASTGAEVFQSAVIPGFTAIQANANELVRFHCNITTQSNGVIGSGSNSGILNGKFNIFINPSSGSQPNPTTPGAIRLSFPLVNSDDGDETGFGTPNQQSLQYHYGELLWLSSAAASATLGVSAYLSATFTADGLGSRVFGELFTAANISTSTILVETLGQM